MALASDWYLPALHGVHSPSSEVSLLAGLYVPFAHGRHLPFAPLNPGAQSTMVGTRTVAFWYRVSVAMVGGEARVTLTPAAIAGSEVLRLRHCAGKAVAL